MTVIGLVLVLSLTLAPFATEAQQVGKVLPNRLARPGRLADSRASTRARLADGSHPGTRLRPTVTPRWKPSRSSKSTSAG